MMPEKLYIPTSTLNFNNIMSSESISPAGFYTRRGFGYKRFEKVDPNSLNNRIVLYAKHPVFDINDEELENYPMVIEIATKDITENIIKEQNGAYFSEETIYLNPFTTKILFRNEQEKIRTLSKSEQSIETKMISLYENCFTVKPENIESENWVKSTIEDTANDISKHISNDIKTNKLKGFMYAYLIASNKSLSDDIVKLKMYTKKLRNTLSAIVTSPDGRASDQQSQQLKSLYKSINETFYKTEGLPEKIDSVIKQTSEKYKCSNLREILKGEGLYDTWLQKQNIPPSYQLQPFPTYGISKSSTETLDIYLYPLEQQISKIELSQKKQKIGKAELPRLQNGVIAQIFDQDTKGDFLIKLFNNYLGEAYKSEEFLQSRYDFTTSGVLAFKEEIKDWAGSQPQKYLNALRTNLNEYKPFEINSTSNLTLKSFACFFQKGEADIDKLEDYLISNEIGDFRIAFGLWGAVFGFANMPKTLTNDLFLSNDAAYTSDIYKFIYKQVHSIDLEGELEVKCMETIKNSSFIDNYTKNIIATPEQLETELSLFGEYKNLDEAIRKEVIGKLFENGITSLDLWDETKANSIKWRSPKGQKRLIKAISKTKKKQKVAVHEQVSTQFSFDMPSEDSKTFPFEKGNSNLPVEKEFYRDERAFEVIEPMLRNCDEKTIKQVEKNLKWFQNNYKEQYDDKNKKEKGRYYTNPKDNISVIENFNSYCLRPWPNGDKPKIEPNLLEQIIKKLREMYL